MCFIDCVVVYVKTTLGIPHTDNLGGIEWAHTVMELVNSEELSSAERGRISCVLRFSQGILNTKQYHKFCEE